MAQTFEENGEGTLVGMQVDSAPSFARAMVVVGGLGLGVPWECIVTRRMITKWPVKNEVKNLKSGQTQDLRQQDMCQWKD